jgi:hypothetical protein
LQRRRSRRVIGVKANWLADHIGFELRSAERKFISLTCRVNSHSGDRRRRPRSRRRMIFSVGRDPLLTAIALSSHCELRTGTASLRHIEVRILPPGQIRFELRYAGRRFSSIQAALRCNYRAANQPEYCGPARHVRTRKRLRPGNDPALTGKIRRCLRPPAKRVGSRACNAC